VISRREWLAAGAAAAFTPIVLPAAVLRQNPTVLTDTSNLFPMDQGAARPVRLPPKPGARPSMTPEARDALEHQIRCQCGCTLDVFTCRTTDFSCQVSPSMHRDVMALVQGGYVAGEILEAFVNVYGERVLMAPPRVGFNIVGYMLPGVAMAIAAILLAVLIRRWTRPMSPATPGPVGAPPDATPDEMRRIDDAVRDDS
jgi:cytochrome c-type biogenesis protein CcmH